MRKTTPKLFQTAVMLLVLLSIMAPNITAGFRKQDPQHSPPADAKTIPDGTEFTVVTVDEITSKKAGMMGRGGSLGIRVESSTTVDNQKIKLRSTKGKEGDDKTGTTVALVVLFGPLGFLKKGKNAVIKPGTQIKVYTDEEKKVTIKG